MKQTPLLEHLQHAGGERIELLEGQFALVLSDDATLRVDEHQRRPGPAAEALPDGKVPVIHHRMLDAIPEHRFPQVGRLALSRELGRMDADHDHPVSILLFDLPQLRKGVHAVDSTEGPEIDDCQPPAQVGDVQRPGYVEPVEPFREVGGANHAGVGVNGHRSMVPTPRSWASSQRYNMPNTMSASGWWRSRPGRLTWPARRPSLRAVLIAILAAGLALSSRGASAILLNGQPTRSATAALASTPAAAEDAVISADSNRLTGAVQADPHAVRASAQVALAAGRNDATVATFLKLRWAGRLSAAPERLGPML